jgi:ribosome maturation factor RimP
MNRETVDRATLNRDTLETSTEHQHDAGNGSVRFFREQGLAAEIARIAEPVIEGLGFRLVRVKISGGADGQTVQVMAERPDGTMAIEDCELVSRDLSAVFDTFDPISAAYRLEISSPGIDRPLVRPSDFEDWAGHEARIELKEPVSGRKRWKGEIEGLTDGEARMVCDIEGLGQQTVGFPVELIAEAKLVLTDELVREALRASKKNETGDAGPAKAHGKPGKPNKSKNSPKHRKAGVSASKTDED